MHISQVYFSVDSTILIVGARRSRKTVLCSNILNIITNKYQYYSIILFSETADIELNGIFKKIVNHKLIYKT